MLERLMMLTTFHNLTPMLLTPSAPFDSDDFIFEIKFDGIRCLCLIDGAGVTLKTRNGRDITALFPELADIYKCVKQPCVLDGELVALKDGKPDLYSLLQRSNRSEKNGLYIGRAGLKREVPAEYAVFDMLFYDGQDIKNLPLLKRKLLLSDAVKEGHNLSLVRHIEGQGTAFFNLIKERGLEGIVAKRKDSRYFCGKRSEDWLKIKATTEEDFFVLGFINEDTLPAVETPDRFLDFKPEELLLGKLEDGVLRLAGTLNITVYKSAQKTVKEFAQKYPSVRLETENDEIKNFFKNTKKAVPLQAGLVCRVEYLNKTGSGRLRQPVFKGIRLLPRL